MFPVRDWNSKKESWYIPGIPGTFASFAEAFNRLLDFLKWLQHRQKIDELAQYYTGKGVEELSQLPFFQRIFEEYSNDKGEYLKCEESRNEEGEREDMEDMQR